MCVNRRLGDIHHLPPFAFGQRIALSGKDRLQHLSGFLTHRGPCPGTRKATCLEVVGGKVCDLRIATRTLKYGFPIARTLGNCLSAAALGRLSAARKDGPLLRAGANARFMQGYAIGR